jgi:hypothetical protein
VAAWLSALEGTLWRTIEERLEYLKVSTVSASTRSSVGRFGGTRPAVSSLFLCLVFVGGSLSVDHKGHGRISHGRSLSLESMEDSAIGIGHTSWQSHRLSDLPSLTTCFVGRSLR